MKSSPAVYAATVGMSSTSPRSCGFGNHQRQCRRVWSRRSMKNDEKRVAVIFHPDQRWKLTPDFGQLMMQTRQPQRTESLTTATGANSLSRFFYSKPAAINSWSDTSRCSGSFSPKAAAVCSTRNCSNAASVVCQHPE